jgi:hypothetical protein
MDKPINERWITISGKIPVPFDIKQDDDVTLVVEYNGVKKHYIVNAVSYKLNSNQDGTDDKITTLKSTLE